MIDKIYSTFNLKKLVATIKNELIDNHDIKVHRGFFKGQYTLIVENDKSLRFKFTYNGYTTLARVCRYDFKEYDRDYYGKVLSSNEIAIAWDRGNRGVDIIDVGKLIGVIISTATTDPSKVTKALTRLCATSFDVNDSIAPF